MEDVRDEIYDGKRDFYKYGDELNKQLNQLPMAIIDIRWVISEQKEDSCQVSFHWNADDDLADTGLIDINCENNEGEWDLTFMEVMVK